MDKKLVFLNKIFPLLMKYFGLLGVVYETLVESVDRPYLLAMFGAMMGLGQILNVNQKGGK